MHPFECRKPLRSQLAFWRSLDRAAARRQTGLFLAEGRKVVTELLASRQTVQALLVSEEEEPRWASLLAAVPEKTEVYCLSARQWHSLSQDKNPEGIMAVAAMLRQTDLSALPDRGHVLLAYGINNPNNLGALIRTAHWFGFGALLIGGQAVDYTNPKVVRTSMGSLFHMTVIADLDLASVLPKLKERFFLVASSSKQGVPPHPCTQRAALLMGSETHGLPEDLAKLAEETWCIPGAGSAESLSLPQAAAIMMYEAAKIRG